MKGEIKMKDIRGFTLGSGEVGLIIRALEEYTNKPDLADAERILAISEISWFKSLGEWNDENKTMQEFYEDNTSDG